jgi:hypothetical protein
MSGISAAEFGDDEASAFKTSVATVLDGVEEDNVGNIVAKDGRRRRQLLSGGCTISYDIQLSLSETGFGSAEDLASDLNGQISSSVSTGEFTESLAATAGSSSTLASATATGVDSVLSTRPPSTSPTLPPSTTAGCVSPGNISGFNASYKYSVTQNDLKISSFDVHVSCQTGIGYPVAVPCSANGEEYTISGECIPPVMCSGNYESSAAASEGCTTIHGELVVTDEGIELPDLFFVDKLSTAPLIKNLYLPSLVGMIEDFEPGESTESIILPALRFAGAMYIYSANLTTLTMPALQTTNRLIC